MKGIPGRYTSETTATRAIYPSSKQAWYIAFLVCSKGVLCTGIFLAYDLLKAANVVPLVCLLKLVAGVIFVYIQKPFSVGPSLTQSQWFRVVQFAVLRAVQSVLWFYGLSLCGPFRTILITQHYEFAIVTGLGALFTGVGAPAVYRGTFLFVGAVVSLLFIDHDEGQEHPGNSHAFSNLSSWLDFADHKFGVLLLVIILLVKVGVNAISKRVASDVGGVKRLHSLVTLIEGVLLLPWMIIVFVTQENGSLPLMSFIIPLVLCATMVFVISYYVDMSVNSLQLDIARVARIGSVSLFIWALFAAILWQKIFSKINLNEPTLEDHMVSGGSIVACTLFIL
ncbi:hypothetical protein L9F63_014932, partial [Diploptera punctata]